jgi:predicted metalloprotease
MGMDWTPVGSDSDVEDRRDESGGGGGGGGFGFGPVHLGFGGIIVLGILSLLFHQNLFTLFSGGGGEPAPRQQVEDPAQKRREQPQVEFVTFVVHDVQQNWDQLLPQQENVPYRHAKLEIFRRSYPSACGTARSAIGPFYCPEDERVYLDLSFFEQLRSPQFGAPGEFAQAYVIAHEFGHHVQKILGIEPKVHQAQQRNPSQANALSVRLELQADCFAGIWGHTAEQRNIVHESDINDGLRAAASVGDDRLQQMSRGEVSPESFTHGSSAQRQQWFRRGLDTGEIAACNTFQRSGQ